MTDGIYAAINAMQTTGPNAPKNGVIAESRRPKLVDRSNTMPLAGDLRDDLVDCGAFFGHMPNKAPRAAVSPLYRGAERRAATVRLMDSGPASCGVNWVSTLSLSHLVRSR